ncbi:MAG TPA: sugar ABC transporter ATP-binding protein, partial [Thermomicrobiales bacterium]|nr:sugar ABC transporter ATP-binding protein [Thermomicrobiales bacterium]
MDEAPILDIRHVGKRFPGVRALHDVSFSVARGEIHALVGENGAGKSTLMKILSGVYPDYEGEVVFDGAPLALSSPRDAQRRGIAIIYQELNLIPELTVAENIYLGREPRTAAGLLDAERMKRDASALLARLNLAIPPDRPVKWLRVGEQQLVEVAKALSLEARLLILDEPTSALSQTEIERLFAVVAALQADGVTMIYISHKFDEVFQIADRATVLRDGECIGTLAIDQTDAAALIRMMVGRNLSDLYPKEDATVGDEALRVEHLQLAPDDQHGGRDLHDISFAVRRGEIVGVAGLMGAGRTELLETLFGVHPPRRVHGRVTIGGRERRIASPRVAIDAGLAFVTEDRKMQGLALPLSVGHNMTLAALGR